MRGRIIEGWSRVDFKSPADQQKFVGAMNFFMQKPERNPELRGAIQAFTTKGDFPADVRAILDKYKEQPEFDLGYEQIFDIRDFTRTQESGFDIATVKNGLMFSEIKVGEKAKLYKMSGDLVTVPFYQYGGGLGWSRIWFDDKKYWLIEDTAIAFRNRAYFDRSNVFYNLIEGIGAGQNLAWQAVEGSIPDTNENYVPIRDVKTINAACLGILTDLQGLGMGATANSEFILLAPVALKERLIRALALVSQPFAGSPARLVYNVRPVWTMMLNDTASYYICFPKAKAKGGYRQDLTIFADFDMLSYADAAVGWMRFGGAIGEVRQFRRCATA